MASNQPPDLAGLLGMLRRARDPWSRLRLVASGARALTKLTPAQRKDLLRTLGLEGAEELAELAAGDDPRTAAELESALRTLESDPGRVQRLAREVADPRTRRATLSGLAAHLMEAITRPSPPAVRAAPAAAGAATPPPLPSPSAASRGATSQPARPAASPAGQAEGEARPAEPPLTRQERRERAQQRVAAKAAGTSAGSLPPTQVAVPPPSPSAPLTSSQISPSAPSMAGAAAAAAAAEVLATSAPASAAASSPPPLRPTPPAIASAPAAPAAHPVSAATSLAVEFRGPSSRSPLRLLGELRQELQTAPPPSLGALTVLLTQELPADWVRRRALAAVFARGIPSRVDEAVGLLAHLGSAGTRAWALADLAASRAWTDADWERLLAAAESPALRRRLAARRRP